MQEIKLHDLIEKCLKTTKITLDQKEQETGRKIRFMKKINTDIPIDLYCDG